MSGKMTQRRRQLDNKRSSSINNENSSGNVKSEVIAAARRRNNHRQHSSSSRNPIENFYRSLTKRKFPLTIPSYVFYILFVLILAFFTFRAQQIFFDYRENYEYTNTPIDLPKLVSPNDTSPQKSPERFWGTYRSNLYFGLKHRSAQSLSAGLMWFDYLVAQKSADRFVRHWADQNDRLKYGWISHDGETFGVENIQDENLNLNIEFVKEITGKHGGDWTTRINLTAQHENRPAPITLFFYFHHDLPWIEEINDENQNEINVRGETNELETFNIRIKLNNFLHQPIVSKITENFQLEKIHEQIFSKLKSKENLLSFVEQPLKDFEHNSFVLQITLRQPVPGKTFSFDVIYQSDSSNSQREKTLTGTNFVEKLNFHQKKFEERFENIFQLKKKSDCDAKKIAFARSTLSNLLGGISYFTGKSLVAKTNQKIPDEYWLTNLFTAVPSRSFFPRGFLWDEGFHNLLIARWNPEITIEILSHWFDLLNKNGWIPREIILGNEARARVPAEFIVQKTSNANPPTFFLTIDFLLKNRENHRFFTLPFVERAEKWFLWYNKTQSGRVPLSFRWRGRNSSSIFELNPKTLTSGLDDFPRASNPSEDERHLDLRCWMALASSVIGKLYALHNRPEKSFYENYAKLLSDNEILDRLHWSENDRIYADFGFHTDFVQLQRVAVGKPPNQQIEMHRQITKTSDLSLKFVKHFGYVSLFPLITRLIDPQSDKLEQIFNDLQNSTLLWTPFGLRSLARSSSLYAVRNTEHDPPYWRGAIWINMNFMVLSALQHYAKIGAPSSEKAGKIYNQLRSNLINNMFRVYEKTGHVWEQYDDKTGNGQGSHPFTGWSSLIVLIMSELYDE